MGKPKKLSKREMGRALVNVARTTYRASPSAVIVKLVDAVIAALLPLATAYFAALTTTSLAAAFAGDDAAGERALMYVIVTAAIGIASSVWSSVQQHIDELTSYRIDAAVSDMLYEQFIQIEYWRYDDKETADMFDRAQNFAMFFSRMFGAIATIVGSIVQAVAAVMALFTVYWWIGVLVLAATIPGILVQVRLSRLQASHWRRTTEARRKMNGIGWSVFQVRNLAELRVYGVAKHLLELRAKYRDMDRLERIDYERKYLGKRLMSDMIEAVAELVALLAIAQQIIQRVQPLGQFIFVQQMVSRAFGGVHRVVSEFNRIDEDIATLADFEAFMRLPRVTVGRQMLPSPPQEITFTDVSFRYPNAESIVLDNINLTIKAGQRIAIVGENGAGKSTLMKLLMGFYQPDSGSILVDGVSLASINEHEWHRQLGVLQQSFVHYNFMNMRENVELGDVTQPRDDARLERALEQAEAKAFVEKLPKQLDTIPNQWYEHDDGTNGVDLSGGQWQRLALARNFYRQSPIVILDEPTSAIDALAESRIFNRLFSKHDNTIIVISHRYTTIKKADVVYMMKDGRIVESGTSQELIARRGEFYRLFESQL